MDRVFLSLGSGVALIGVALGAFAAHVLRARVTPDLLAAFETGVRYHMYHALALVGVAWACTRWPGLLVSAAGGLFLAGIVLFSGSLYAMTMTGHRWLGAITPFGGLAFLLGWFALGVGVWRAS